MRVAILMLVFFLTSLVSVVTGSTSLITVPVLIAFGIETHVAVATNMLALTFMSAGGSIPFLGKGIIHRGLLPWVISLTLVGSAIGAIVMLRVPARTVQLTVAAAMIGAVALTLTKPGTGLAKGAPSPALQSTGYVLTFLLAIYGGFFSGGYVTMLTPTFVFFFGITLLESVATTKVVNIFSSGVATLVFLWRGTINLKLGIMLGIAMFLGAIWGSRMSMKLSPVWLRRIFIAVVFGMALKMLFGATR